MKKIIARIKESLGFMTSRFFYLTLGMMLAIGIYVAQAAWNTTVTSGSTLTATLWNDVVNKLVAMDTQITSTNGQISTLNSQMTSVNGQISTINTTLSGLAAGAGYTSCQFALYCDDGSVNQSCSVFGAGYAQIAGSWKFWGSAVSGTGATCFGTGWMYLCCKS